METALQIAERVGRLAEDNAARLERIARFLEQMDARESERHAEISAVFDKTIEALDRALAEAKR